VLFHRATGRIVGPVAPIFSEDWPLDEISDSEIVWRYMDCWKFEDLVQTSTLYFPRADKLKDPFGGEDAFEGRPSPGNLQRRSKSDEAFHQLYNIDDRASREYPEIHRTVVFISCWHRNTQESFRMWRAYTTSSDSVVVVTSGRALREFLPQDLMKYGVSYKPLDFPRTQFTHNSLFFYKPTRYRFEREFRILRSPNEDESFYRDDPKDWFRRIPIGTKRIIHRVITHPNATIETKLKVEKILRQYLSCREREDSALEL
jgi:hypothetical protein